MGAWGTKPFDNDDAADWAAQLDESDDALAFARQTLQDVLDADDSVEASAGNEAIAAAAWVTSGLPGEAPVDPEYGPETAPTTPDDALLELTVAALQRVLSDRSELVELWAEAADVDRAAFTTSAQGLISTAEAALQP
ncbi:MAG: DUF4259 domain-containing protein [Actinomycetota bacterium]|nr:DUF4259 domain-containing protein [Actinomycetota bacterium]